MTIELYVRWPWNDEEEVIETVTPEEIEEEGEDYVDFLIAEYESAHQTTVYQREVEEEE